MVNISYIIGLLLIIVFCYPMPSFAFVVPDVTVIGKAPQIYSVTPGYLIPGDKVKIIGENFLSSPKSANKLFINDKKVRIVSATNNELEFVVPKLSFGPAMIRLYVQYLGIQSIDAVYPNGKENVLQVTFRAPEVSGISSTVVKPMQKLSVFGNFNLGKDIYFNLNEISFKGKIVSPRKAEFYMPHTLPLSPIKLKMFYKKMIFSNDTAIYFDSALSKEFLVYNIQFGNPEYLSIYVESKSLTQIPSEEIPYRVDLIFNNGQKVDVTEFTTVSVDNNDVIEINELQNQIRVKQKGRVNIKASLVWGPSLEILEDVQEISIDLPRAPLLHEVVIDEIFPFASGFFPATDANKDGFARINDEFIELKNLTGDVFDLSGCQFFVNEKNDPVVVLPDKTLINPFEYLVLYGDQAIDGSLTLSNSGAVIEVVCNDQTVDFIAYPKGKDGDHSWQRNSNLNGFVKHPDKMFSPGKPPPVVASMIENNEEVVDVTEVVDEEELEMKDGEVATIVNLEVLPKGVLIFELQSVQVKVTAILSDGMVKDITSLASYETIAGDEVVNVSSSGNITPLMNGQAIVQVEYEDAKTEFNVAVDIQSNVAAGDLIINEILAAPDQDTNGDGKFQSADDEFIELVNISGGVLDLSGLIVLDNTKERHVVPLGTVLESLQSLVIFGGGNTDNLQRDSLFQIASDGGLGLNNTGAEQVIIQTVNGEIIDKVEFNSSGIKGVSLNREVDLQFGNLASHNELSIENYSPGTRIDLTSFASNLN